MGLLEEKENDSVLGKIDIKSPEEIEAEKAAQEKAAKDAEARRLQEVIEQQRKKDRAIEDLHASYYAVGIAEVIGLAVLIWGIADINSEYSSTFKGILLALLGAATIIATTIGLIKNIQEHKDKLK